MPRRPTISVAICLFNSSRFIDETLASVFAQTFRDYELILVDDGSTDGCADAIERRYRDRNLTMIRQEHRGLSIARRLAIASATGKFVAFLDSDDLWFPDKLERQIAAANSNPSVALLCSDCLRIDEHGAYLGRISDDYALAGVDLTGSRAYAELLRRGCFVWQSTVLARTDVLKSVDSFNPIYPYIADYDTWLRIARRYPLHYMPDVLAKWRVHAKQFTNRCPDITLADHRKLLGPLYRTASIPQPIRVSIGARVFGQHLVSCRDLVKQKRFAQGARAAIGMFSYPRPLLASCRKAIAEAPVVGRGLRTIYRSVRHVIRHLKSNPARAPQITQPHVWIDGSMLGVTQTGYFSLVSELIRTLVTRHSCTVHVETSASGREALKQRLHGDAAGIEFHESGWRANRWISGSTSSRFSARTMRWLWRRLRAPRGHPPQPDTIEVVVWRGYFRWAHSRHIAIVQDLTTKIHPELHTAGNVAEFEQFLGYVHRYAEDIVTISEHSRRDILDRLSVFPDSVSIMPMPLDPCYVNPQLNRAFVTVHGIHQPYVLCVGTIEPRKNLRRLVRALELLKDEDAVRDHILVFAGPQGWDEGFARFLIESDIYPGIRTLGFVPTEHLPSLYHFASAVVYPSLYEGFGIPVFEAMAASGIVLAASTSSLPEVLGDGITFDPYRADAIAAAILQALSMTPQEAIAYRRRCRLRAEVLLKRSAEMSPLPGLPAPVSLTAPTTARKTRAPGTPVPTPARKTRAPGTPVA